MARTTKSPKGVLAQSTSKEQNKTLPAHSIELLRRLGMAVYFVITKTGIQKLINTKRKVKK